ncbi:unnamed protein product [Protopolystoma xenopodis]|uniref:Uncharacterized protein n=1 Tax=Protopolystoma xenopodis TaxID=117903 RepID=A0A3S5CRB7_9PLAT|nr:unnamed protein product [Protopolystoma xenopodis]
MPSSLFHPLLPPDEVSADLTASREQTSSAQLQATRMDEALSETRQEAEKRERELCAYLAHLESKNSLVTSLLDIVQERANELQDEFDRYVPPT